MATYTIRKQGALVEFESDMDLETAYDLVSLNPHQSDFAKDLCLAYRQYGANLTLGRIAWLIYMAEESKRRSMKYSPTSSIAGTLDKVKALFTKASEHLKFPKIRLQTSKGKPVALAMSGPRSKYQGSIQVTTGESFGTPGSYFGRIEEGPEGITTTVSNPDVLAILTEFAADPAAVAARYGRGTGNCCFCGRELTNSEAGSVSVGYGPKCARHYGLPWQPNSKDYEYREGALVHSACP